MIKRPAEELYDLEKDPWEMNNLIDEKELANIKKELSQQLDAWMKQQSDKGMKTELKAKPRFRMPKLKK